MNRFLYKTEKCTDQWEKAILQKGRENVFRIPLEENLTFRFNSSYVFLVSRIVGMSPVTQEKVQTDCPRLQEASWVGD